MNVNTDSFRSERSENPVTIYAQKVLPEPDNVQVIGVLDVIADTKRSESRVISKCLVISACDGLPARNEIVHSSKLAYSERALEIAQTIVVAQRHHVILPGLLLFAFEVIRRDAMVSETSHLLSRL